MGKNKKGSITIMEYPSTFDPQKIDVDEHIDLINTLGNMLGQIAESKMEKFVVQRAFFNYYYANGLSSANCFFLFLCRMLLALFVGFLVPSRPKLALVFGECL